MIRILLLVLITMSTVFGGDLFVSPDGDDRNPGTKEQPFLTINRAQMAARGLAGETRILLRKGTYYLEKPLVFTAEDSRADSGPLTVQAFPGERAVISGAQKIHPGWEKYKGKILRAHLPDLPPFDRLFVNNELMHMARYPNYDESVQQFNGFAEDAISPERMKTWSDPAGAYFHAMHRAMWGDMHYVITGIDENGEAVLEGGFQNNRPMGIHKKFRMVENVFEELDAPGEWFFDRATSQLYFYPPEKIEPENALIEVSALKSLVQVFGTERKPVRNITFRNLVFEKTSRTFMEKYEPLLRSDWTVYRGGALFFEGAERCAVRDCDIVYIGGNAVFVSSYNRNIEITSNKMEQIGASAVLFVGDPAAVRSPSFQYHEFVPFEKMDLTPGPQSNRFPADCLVEDNLIHHIGRVEKQTAGVEIAMAMNITVRHNSIYFVPRAGINIGDGTWGGHLIEGNDVFDTVLETGDHGSFNSWGRDRFWHPKRETMDQLAREYPELIKLDAIYTTIIRSNRFRCDHGWDIDLDDGSSNYEIYNNLCLNGGIKLREGFNRRVENNVMINNSFHPHVWFENSGDVFRRNVVADWYKPIRLQGWGDDIDYNIFPDSAALMKSQAEGLDQHGIVGGTSFLSPETGDYRLASGDPAFSAGFVNLSVNAYGVVSPRLKKEAKTPQFPVPLVTISRQENRPLLWRGLLVKNIDSPAEQSAAGLPDMNGALVIGFGEHGKKVDPGLKKGDVILRFGDEDVKNVKDLVLADKSQKWKSSLEVLIYRNQQPIKLRISNE